LRTLEIRDFEGFAISTTLEAEPVNFGYPFFIFEVELLPMMQKGLFPTWMSILNYILLLSGQAWH
jgi:hypothetical protein